MIKSLSHIINIIIFLKENERGKKFNKREKENLAMKIIEGIFMNKKYKNKEIE